MSEQFEKLLVSSPNGGGVFLVHEGNIFQLDNLSTTGLFCYGKGVVRGLQPAGFCIYEEPVRSITSQSVAFDDVHDVHYEDGYFYLVGTSGNEILKLTKEGEEVQRWVFPGEKDSWHINCLATWNGRIVFSAFGDFRGHRGYKGNTDKVGFVQDLLTGERLITELSQPHSLVPFGNNLLLANSERMEILEFSLSGDLLRSKPLNGYARGICIGKSAIYVGLSCSRNIESAGINCAAIVSLDPDTLEELGRIDLPANEIYGIQYVDDRGDLIRAISAIASSSSAKMADLLSARDGQIVNCIEGMSERDSQIASLTDEIERQHEFFRDSERLKINIAQLENAHELAAKEINRLNQLLILADEEDRRKQRQIEQQQELVQDGVRLSGLLASAEAEVQHNQQQLARERERLSQLLLIAEEKSLLQWQLQEKEHLLFEKDNALNERDHGLEACHGELHRVTQKLQAIYGSRSMRLTAPLRWASKWAAKGIRASQRIFWHYPRSLRRLSNAIAHVRTHGSMSALRRARELLTGAGASTVHSVMPIVRFELRDHARVYVLSTHHCLFVAELITRQLARIGIECAIIFERPVGGFADVPHFVVCPQMFTELPGLYVAFQMEQTVSSRWLTPEYLRTLENSFAIFDYSTNNLAYFSKHGLSQKQLNYMPISWLPDYDADVAEVRLEKEYDVIFYGDANNERRREFIARIEEKYKVKLIDNLFGSELYCELRKARVIINVHYYEGALLETTRLYECLSLGCLVVSESSVDIEQHQQLREVVDFVEVGDADSMLARLDFWLTDVHAREARLARNLEILRAQPNEFEYYFQRFLLASGNINFEQFYSLAGDNIRFAGNFACLGLPESVERRADFDKDNAYGIEYFPGLRHPLGWIGCGMSYKFIMRKAAEQGLPWIIVCEDDVEFTPGWRERLAKVLIYLQAHPNDWDVFSGFIADLHEEARVTSIAEQDGLELVHIDKMVSAVFNVYNASFYQAILKWDESNHDVHGNAIDRYMENHVGIRVVTIHPFLVGHKEEQKSTLWGVDNSTYNEMICKSTVALEQKIETYRRNSNSGLLKGRGVLT